MDNLVQWKVPEDDMKFLIICKAIKDNWIVQFESGIIPKGMEKRTQTPKRKHRDKSAL